MSRWIKYFVVGRKRGENVGIDPEVEHGWELLTFCFSQ
jgi:hypothetical protein